jgi:tetratricopeptide (TPR) repeat protein
MFARSTGATCRCQWLREHEPVTDSRPRTAPIGTSEMLRLAASYCTGGRLQEADALYRRVLSLHPRHPEALYGRGTIAARMARGADAIDLLRRAVAAKHDMAPAHADLARLLAQAGRLDDAMGAAQRAVRFGAHLVQSHVVLGEILAERGDLSAAEAAFVAAVEADPEQAEPRYQLGLVRQRLGRLDEAATSLAEALSHAPKRPDLHYSLGTVLHRQGRLDEAVSAYEQALRLQPNLAERLFDVGKPRHIHALLERGDLTRALDRLEGFLARHPGQSCALALKAIVLDDLGRRDEARQLVDMRNLITTRTLDGAPGFADVEALNAALRQHILGHPTLRAAPESFSVHRGLTTGELLGPPRGPVDSFVKVVQREVELLAASLPEGSTHPFVAHRPRSWTLTMWANIIEAEGFQVPHIHPSGWLSAVYYVQVPEVVRQSGDRRAGWIEFGEPYDDIAHRAKPETMAVQPEAGMLLLFPSYFYHRTLPFEGDEQRISIAFDVVPKR